MFDKPQVISENQFMGRVDYNLTKHRLYGRYFFTKLDSDPISGKVNLVASGPGFKYSDQAFPSITRTLRSPTCSTTSCSPTTATIPSASAPLRSD